MSAYHVPVMLKECIECLNIKPNGVYVDLTFGGGGHSKEILKYIKDGKLFSFDQDEDAAENYLKEKELYGNNFTLIEANFRYLKKFLRINGITKVDGILADLGVSSHQFDKAERGFSFRFDAKLDMRMSQQIQKTAFDILNQYSESDLHKILGMYGEIINAKTLAQYIVNERVANKIYSTQDLKTIAGKFAKRGHENKYLAQIFQALRIEVNEEMKALEEMLPQTAEVLNSGGRLVIMTYHSLEDRPVKNYLKHGKITGEAEKDVFGNVNVPFESITRKPIEADEDELAQNPRARSAKLRVARRV
jgi:16S rRNA (cytosine1402-N4)-methyltransferase